MQRRARDRDGKPIAPMTLGNMRSLAVHSLDVDCEESLCGHAAQINVSAVSDDVCVVDVALHLHCSKCGSKAVSTRPHWLEYRASGTPYRLPQ